MSVLKEIFLFIIGLWWLWLIVALFAIITVASDHDATTSRVGSSICYSKGMIRITTDAGFRCVDPKNLVEVK